jgi:hypothetical protein
MVAARITQEKHFETADLRRRNKGGSFLSAGNWSPNTDRCADGER